MQNLEDKQRVLWYFPKWPVTANLDNIISLFTCWKYLSCSCQGCVWSFSNSLQPLSQSEAECEVLLWNMSFHSIESRPNFYYHIKIFALRLALEKNSEMVHLSIMLGSSWVHDSWVIWLYFLQTCNCVSFCPVPEATATKSVTNEGQTVATVHPHPAPTEPMIQPSHCVAGYSDGTIRIFDLGKVEMIMKMQPHNASITAISFSADGKNSGNLKRHLMK